VVAALQQIDLAWLESLGYAILHGPDIAAGMPAAEQQDYNWLRDTQLPNLISGKLRAKDAERQIEEATA
jgi:hypothetical protein